MFGGCTSLEDYFFDAVNGLPTYSLPQYKKDKVTRLQETVARIKKDYYTNGNKYLALVELESLLPMP